MPGTELQASPGTPEAKFPSETLKKNYANTELDSPMVQFSVRYL